MRSSLARTTPPPTKAPTDLEALTWLKATLPEDIYERVVTLITRSHRLIDAQLHDPAPPLAIAAPTVRAGGKRVRMILTTLSGIAGGQDDETIAAMAAAAELVHAATLIHDDVIDQGERRRGQPTANVLFGNKRAVLGGDALLVQALRLLADSGHLQATRSLLRVIEGMVEGEYLQIKRQHKLPVDVEAALQVNHLKTGLLFGWCASAPMAVAQDSDTAQHAGCFGLAIGEAFQLVDDLLDIVGTDNRLGKATFQDLREGKITVPMAWLLEDHPEFNPIVARCWRAEAQGGADDEVIDRLCKAAKASDLETRVRADVAERIERANTELAHLPNDAICAALETLTTTLVERLR